MSSHSYHAEVDCPSVVDTVIPFPPALPPPLLGPDHSPVRVGPKRGRPEGGEEQDPKSSLSGSNSSFPLPSSMTLDKSRKLSVTRFPHLSNGDRNP